MGDLRGGGSMRILRRLIREPRFAKVERVAKERALRMDAERERKIWERRAFEDRACALWGDVARMPQERTGRRGF
jgi:nitric oxide synthase oxygenase domain/subunit